jgi:hypothetical protein
VPSPPHEHLVDLFRKCGELAPELLARCADIAYRHDRVEVTSIDLSQAASIEYRADGVVELRTADNTVVAAVIVEVQLSIDPDKKHSWPVYVCALRANLKCPVVLLVLTSDSKVARWARRPIDLGHPDFHLTPVVISFEDVPRILDPSDAHRLPQLAVLSALAHPELEIAETALDAIAPLPTDESELYFDLILASVPEQVRQLLEVRFMQGYQYQSEFARRYYNQGREAGREEGRSEGLRNAVLTLARGRFAAVTDDEVAALTALHDGQVLNELIAALARPGTVDEARAAFDRVLRARPR